jgi:hypothetical protein
MTIPVCAASVGYRYLCYGPGLVKNINIHLAILINHNETTAGVFAQYHFLCPEFETGSFHDGDIMIWQIQTVESEARYLL